MAFQNGSTPIANGASSVTVVFDALFASVPQIVLSAVANYTDATVLILQPVSHSKDAAGFTVELDGVTDSGNYVLEWVAGSTDIILQTLTSVGKAMNELQALLVEPAPSTLIPLMVMSPLPASKVVTWAVLKALFAYLVATPPEASNSSGSFGNISSDDDYVYFHDGTEWIRIPREASGGSWLVDSAIKPARKGVASLTSGDQVQVIAFATPFASGSAPSIVGSVFNVAVEDKLLLSGMVTAATLSGFTLTLTTAPDSANYQFRYTAEQL